MKHTSDLVIEKNDRLSPMLLPTGDNTHTAMISVGEISNDVNLKFREHEALLRLIAVLVTAEREWSALDEAAGAAEAGAAAAKEFHAEPAN